MSEISPSHPVFRYFPDEDRAYESFERGQLWFSNVTDFNDPFDVLPSFDNVAGQITWRQRKVHFAFTPPTGPGWNEYRRHNQNETELVRREMTEVGPRLCKAFFTNKNAVVCFSSKRDSIVMWAHYASDHQGFVLEFDVTHPFFSAPYFRKVDYTKTRPRADDPDRIRTVFTKGRDWEYEGEFRLIRPRDALKQVDGKPGHYADLPVEAIKAIYFGCRMCPVRREQLLELLQQPNYKKIQPFQMFPDTRDYCLVPERWSEPVKERADFFFELECETKKALNSPSFKETLRDVLQKRVPK